MRHLKRILFGSLLAAASLQAMACYTVYDRSNRIMYQGEQPPVDMSLPIHETLPARFPGGHMVFDSDDRLPGRSLPRDSRPCRAARRCSRTSRRRRPCACPTRQWRVASRWSAPRLRR